MRPSLRRTERPRDRHGEIAEVRGDDGGPPWFVRFDDGHESLVFPGPDCSLEHT